MRLSTSNIKQTSRFYKKRLKIPKGYTEAINRRRTENKWHCGIFNLCLYVQFEWSWMSALCY